MAGRATQLHVRHTDNVASSLSISGFSKERMSGEFNRKQETQQSKKNLGSPAKSINHFLNPEKRQQRIEHCSISNKEYKDLVRDSKSAPLVTVVHVEIEY
jgi:hypothetical protein